MTPEEINEFNERNPKEYFKFQDWALEIISGEVSDRPNEGYLLINPITIRISIDMQIMSLEQEGLLFEALAVAHQNLNFDFIKAVQIEYGFIERYTIGNTKRPHLPLDIKRDVLKIGKCEFCGSDEKLSIDHIKPISKGGTNDRENLQCLCLPCNLQKSNKWEEND